MNRKNFMIVLRILLIITLAAVILPTMYNYFHQPSAEEAIIGYNATSAYAMVERIIEEGEITLGEVTQPYQVFLVEVLDGPRAGQIFQVEYGTRQIRSEKIRLKTGDKILVTLSENPVTQEVSANFTDFDRRFSLLWLFVIFCVLSVAISGWKGVRSLLGILLSIFVIIFIILPGIREGRDPLLVTLAGAALFMSLSLYIVYGWTIKTHTAFIGSLFAMTFTGVMALIFVNSTRLTGFGDENVFYIAQMTSNQMNYLNLLLAGIIIGTLGVLDDLVVSQSSAVFELYKQNPQLSILELYRSSMNIGKDHIAATVNTLVLAYAGTSLPMLLLFSYHDIKLSMILNLEYIAEEIVRTLVGSLGLFAAVPVTTLLAALVAVNYRNFGKLKVFLGPLNE